MRSSYVALSVLLAVLIVSAVMPASAHINLLQNPGFETGQGVWFGDGTDGFDIGVLSNGAHGGTHYLQITTGPVGSAGVWQLISPPQCAEYLEFWYEGSGHTTVVYSDDTYTIKFLSPAEGWTFVHVNLNTAKGVISTMVYTSGGAYLNVDDFDLEAGTCPAVGGVVMPANTFAVLAPWLAVIGLVGCIGVVGVVVKRRRT
jgi:hypothetical protein